MTDPFPMRLNSRDRPDRTERMTELEIKWRISSQEVIRGLVDAYLEYVDKNGGLPPHFPVKLVTVAEYAAMQEELTVLREESAQYRAKKKP